jgi:hypothetical protein
MYKCIILFIALIALGCEKKDVRPAGIGSDAILNDDYKDLPLADNEAGQIDTQQFIENYETDMIFLFQVDGNFTNSGNREVLAFYQVKSILFIEGVKNNSINRAMCFIYDTSNKTIEKVLRVKGYGTADFDSYFNLDDAPMESLGREIFWLNRRLGYIGDFNDNGKEELYFYEASGRGFYPAFYEFDGEEFRRILDYVSRSVLINNIDVDNDNKTITFRGFGGETQENVSVIWNENKQIYDLIENK